MQQLLNLLEQRLPEIHFVAGETFYWSPETQEVFYIANADDESSMWSLLHETGHALLGHTTYERDVELLKLEMAAWDKAQELASELNITIDEDHIQDCLDTYRDWLHARSVCPTCTTKCLQQRDKQYYRCHNCHTTWKVTPSRFARAYRSVSQSAKPAITFAAELD